MRRIPKFVLAARRDKYLTQFGKYLKKNPDQREEIESRIDFALDKLKEAQRVKWYIARLKEGLKEPGLLKELDEAMPNIVHYISNAEVNEYKSILNLPFAEFTPKHLTFKMQDLEDRELARAASPEKRLIPDEDNPDVSTYLKFSDGWEWHLIDGSSCDLEGRAMDHCGNTGDPHPEDKILSLREPLEQDGKKWWKPHATFIVNNGVLGEMKGYANSKPGKKLHKYILPLLRSDLVQFIEGAGYKPENNFQLSDLDEADQAALLAEKPGLPGLQSYYESNGIDQNFLNYASKRLGAEVEYAGDKNLLIIKRSDLGSAIENSENWEDALNGTYWTNEDDKAYVLKLALDSKAGDDLLEEIYDKEQESIDDEWGEEGKKKFLALKDDPKELYRFLDDEIYASDITSALEEAYQKAVQKYAIANIENYLSGDYFFDEDVWPELQPLHDDHPDYTPIHFVTKPEYFIEQASRISEDGMGTNKLLQFFARKTEMRLPRFELENQELVDFGLLQAFQESLAEYYDTKIVATTITAQDGDYSLYTDESGRFWGDAGAGVVFRAKDTGRYLLAFRSKYVNEPHTWGVWGGAIDEDESPENAAKREVREEAGYKKPFRLQPIHLYKADGADFQYHNFIAHVEAEFEPDLDWETEDYGWFEADDFPDPLHFGLKAFASKLK